MPRPHRRMLALPGAKELVLDADRIRLHKKDRFLFMTYNLLAQALVRRDMFPYASQKALRWKFRRQNLLQEFLDFKPDLACLQEVDFWDEFYLPALTKAGYETVFYKNANKKHGCAIVWRQTRFEKVDQLTLEYDDIGQPTFRTGNIGLMVGLRPIQRKAEAVNPDPNADMILPEEDEEDDKANTSNGESKAAAGDKESGDEEANAPGGILVATTHLFWRPDGSYERLRQASILLDKIKEWNTQLQFTVLLGGDFNTTPRDAAYRAMTRNQMPPQQIPNLEKWLVDEVTRVLQAEVADQSQTAEASETSGSSGEANGAATTEQQGSGVEELAEQTNKLALEESSNTSANTEKDTKHLPYRPPPTGIILPKSTNAKTSPNSSAAEDTGAVMDPKEFAASADPKIAKLTAIGDSGGDDAPIAAPLEAFTPPKDLLAAVESHARCVSVYGQYETLTKDDPAAADEAAAAKTAAEETTATNAHETHTHGEPIFTNYATWFKDTLDYVYLYDEPTPDNGARLVPLRLQEIPDKSHLGHGLPDENFSSDHLCLMVEFALLPRQ
ncbi:Endonuclease/exonuclease/phosphatase [Mortierella sp. GBAus27b]|nr:Endonuclease/exonuclease/phosphatase [Mortierella sp. GBAus27b]